MDTLHTNNNGPSHFRSLLIRLLSSVVFRAATTISVRLSVSVGRISLYNVYFVKFYVSRRSVGRIFDWRGRGQFGAPSDVSQLA